MNLTVVSFFQNQSFKGERSTALKKGIDVHREWNLQTIRKFYHFDWSINRRSNATEIPNLRWPACRLSLSASRHQRSFAHRKEGGLKHCEPARGSQGSSIVSARPPTNLFPIRLKSSRGRRNTLSWIGKWERSLKLPLVLFFRGVLSISLFFFYLFQCFFVGYNFRSVLSYKLWREKCGICDIYLRQRMYLPQRVARCARWWVFLACCEICALGHDLLYRNASRICAGVRVSVAQLFRFLQSRRSVFMV